MALGAALPGAAGAAESEPAAVPDVEPATTEGEDLDPDRLELGLLPALSYNSDLGFGFGAVGTLARFEEGFNPFKWRLEGTVFFTVRDQGDGLEMPLQSHVIALDQPGLANGDLRMRWRLTFSRQSNTGYYGLGSAAPDETSDDLPNTFTQYDRVFPEVGVTARIRLWSEPAAVGKRRLELAVGTSFRYTWMNIYEQSRLALDVRAARDGGALGDLLLGTDDHALWTSFVGLLFDTRDREFDTQRGQFHELSVRGSPGIDDSLAFAGFALIGRWFVPLVPEWLALGFRLAGDLMVGDVPIYELARLGGFEPLAAPGGQTGVRGVPLRRFHGKVKVLHTTELRARLLPFRVASQRFMLGTVAFADVGRVWADYENRTVEVRQPDGTIEARPLDGDLEDLDVGVGAGARLRWGETFIIRVDFGYVPTLGTTGFYIGVGDAF